MAEINMSDLAKVVNAEVDQVIRAVKISLFSGVIRDTRVDTGRLRGNWQTTTGFEAPTETERLDKSGASAIAEVQLGVKPDTVDYLTNNVPYSEIWEERDGMVARNVARIDRTIREQAKA
jgi:hypothetical protein